MRISRDIWNMWMEMAVMTCLRREMSDGNSQETISEIIDTLSSTKSNRDFISFMEKKLR